MSASGASSLCGSMPIPRTRLIGREDERVAARAYLLADAVPLLTLTGPGGVGKTRLALAIAADVAGEYKDGVIWGDLAPLADPSLVPTAIAAALDITPSPDGSLVEQLWRHLQGRHILLLLDNCEHVLAETAEIMAALLIRGPAVQVLATSRAALHVRGEQVLPVEPLRLPAAGMSSLEVLARNDAVRLFVERARAVRPLFTIDHTSALAVAEVCRQLDGLPLAIELAAARSTILPPHALLAQMADRLQWLSDGPRDLPARQRTMRDTIAWSYGLLDPDRQRLFRLLTVFSGGFTLEAARSVVDTVDGSAVSVVSGVAALVDQGLIHRIGPEEAPRFSMLETIREFGRERLAESEEAHAIGMAHATSFLEFAEQHHPNRVEPQERVEHRLQRIEADLANVRAALSWFAQNRDARRLLRLSSALAVFWHLRAYLREGRQWLELALRETLEEPTLSRGQALVGLALILWAQSHYERASAAAKASLAIAEQCGNPELAANALHVLGMVAEIQDHWSLAGEYLTRACEGWRMLGARAEEAWALTLLCRVALGLGNGMEAARHAEQALILFREVGHPSGVATAHSRLGEIARTRGDDRHAAVAYHEALQIWSGIGDRWMITLALAGLADLAAAHDQAAPAAMLVGFLDALARETGAPLLSAARLSRDRALRGASAHLGDEQGATLHAAGLKLTLDEAIVIATAIVVPDRPRGASRGSLVLTAREREVLRLMAGMHTDQEIAEVLSLSRRTVSGHVTHVLAKLDVGTRRAAVARGRELGLLSGKER